MRRKDIDVVNGEIQKDTQINRQRDRQNEEKRQRLF